jgi:hypothetical protein
MENDGLATTNSRRNAEIYLQLNTGNVKIWLSNGRLKGLDLVVI